MNTKTGYYRAVDTFWANIWVAGDLTKAEYICGKWCDEVGACVTVTPTNYIYTRGSEAGMCVRFINYPRFPLDSVTIKSQAHQLAEKLLEGLGQQTYSIETPVETIWISYRPEDKQNG